MYAKNTTVSELQEIGRNVGVEVNASNDGNRIRFTLRPIGENFRKRNPIPVGLDFSNGVQASSWKWRKTPSVCYHGHYVFLAALFRQNPLATVTSSRFGKVSYTAETFEEKAIDYGNTPAGPKGNIYHEFRLKDFCDCERMKVNA